MASDLYRQQVTQQRLQSGIDASIELSMNEVRHQVKRIVASRKEKHLGDTVTLQIWRKVDESEETQALAISRTPYAGARGKRRLRRSWKKRGKPQMFASLKDLNATSDGPRLYLSSDDNLWMQQSDGHPIWPLSDWYSRSGSTLNPEYVLNKLSVLSDRLEKYANLLERELYTP